MGEKTSLLSWEAKRAKLLDQAAKTFKESKYVDFKREFDIGSAAQWCEIIKDVIAFANSSGGVIIFGIHDNGSNADVDTAHILNLDLADITNKIESYTGCQFAEIEIIEIDREDGRRAAFIIGGTDV